MSEIELKYRKDNPIFRAGYKAGLEAAKKCVPERIVKPASQNVIHGVFNTGIEYGHNSCRRQTLEAKEKLII